MSECSVVGAVITQREFMTVLFKSSKDTFIRNVDLTLRVEPNSTSVVHHRQGARCVVIVTAGHVPRTSKVKVRCSAYEKLQIQIR